MKASECYFLFPKKAPKKKLSAASDSMKVIAWAWPVVAEPANAGFFGLFRVCGFILFFLQITFWRNCLN
jgi:hypothetical protein